MEDAAHSQLFDMHTVEMTPILPVKPLSAPNALGGTLREAPPHIASTEGAPTLPSIETDMLTKAGNLLKATKGMLFSHLNNQGNGHSASASQSDRGRQTRRAQPHSHKFERASSTAVTIVARVAASGER